MQHPRRNGAVGDPIDENEPAQLAILGVRIERQRLIELQLHHTNVVDSNRSAARCSSVLTLIRCFRGLTVAVTTLVASFIR